MQESYSKAYADLWRGHWWWQARHRIVLRLLDRWQKDFREDNSHSPANAAGPAILDIGCAGGVAFDDWSRYGDVYGIEPDENLISKTSSWHERVEHTLFDDAYRSPRAYDVVLMLDVLEHIEDDDAAMRKLYSILKPGGCAILTVPALPALWSVHDEVNLHFRRYTKRTLSEVVRRAGVEIRELRYLFFWSLGLVYARKWLSRGKPDAYAVSVPARPVNALMRSLSLCEAWLTDTLGIPVPCGSSLVTILRKPHETTEPLRQTELKPEEICR